MTTIELIRSLPKSLYVSWKLTGNLWRMPILVRYNTCIKSLKGKVIIKGGKFKRAMVKVGFSNVGIFDNKYQRPILEINGTIEINGRTSFGSCARICVMSGGKLTIGNHFSNSAKITIICANSITIYEYFGAGWDTIIMDTDFHSVENILTAKVGEATKPIVIGNNVWVGMRAVILKGSVIPDNCIVAAQSVVNKVFDEPNCVLAGNPATIRKRNVRRKR